MSTAITSYDPQELKASLIAYMQSKPDFADFNYEGSSLNTIIDLLVRNTHYIAYMANMVGTESFLDSAQLRANVVSHAQKLSYVPKSRTASTVVVDLEVTPSAPTTQFSLVCNKGSVFLNTVGNQTYSFTNTHEVTLLKNIQGKFVATGVELKQGQLRSQRYLYNTGTKTINLLNSDIDTSTIRVYVTDPSNGDIVEYLKVENIVDVDTDSAVFYLYENTQGKYDIQFGRDVLGREPVDQSIVNIEYVGVEAEHANGLKTLVAGTPIGNYSNIKVTVTTEAYGGAERSDIDFIKFIAPKIWETQNRAVRAKDYVAIMLREFPFIKSAIAWGGETVTPPVYGTVFLCAIPQEGFVIADTVKDTIKKRITEFSVVSITPEVVDAKYIGLQLDVGILYDSSKTTNTFTQTVAAVKNSVNKYNDTSLKLFDLWYNNSALTQLIRTDTPAVYSIEIDKKAFIDISISRNVTTQYIAEFLNPIEPGSLTISDVVFDINATQQRIFDDGEGNIVKSVTKNEVTKNETIGSVNYTTGYAEFNALLLEAGTVRFTVTPVTDNFYTERNYAVYVDTINVDLLTSRKV
ncbi:hypothetical protein pf16_211 [Pseudomonas phage pf16]|uniref:Baseplate wedge protein gp6-like N-terminal helical domain-containing protein n=1 Tax=Pseudomonas phage pf16 TaxID=1815630 RepID=A0A1S5R475_9CAUD|nr:baseplate wedge subunit [Pseudomonas phage pf16]AND75134.1 hypothetical protein pf16_211 [Pseudomonas phage pf16]